jgi:hypothetical protein
MMLPSLMKKKSGWNASGSKNMVSNMYREPGDYNEIVQEFENKIRGKADNEGNLFPNIDPYSRGHDS